MCFLDIISMFAHLLSKINVLSLDLVRAASDERTLNAYIEVCKVPDMSYLLPRLISLR